MSTNASAYGCGDLYNYFRKNNTSNIHVKIACPCIDRSDVPVTNFNALARCFIANVQSDPLITYGMKIDHAYETIFDACIERKMTHVFIVESDVVVPKSALDRLLMRSVAEGHAFVGGVYPFKNDTDICPAVTGISPEQMRVPQPYVRRGLVPITHALPMGCCVIDLRVLATLPKPWVKTTEIDGEYVTQDTWLTALFNLNGYTPMLDTNIQCVHVARDTGRHYGDPALINNYQIRQEAKDYFAL